MHTFSKYWATLQNLIFSNVALCLSMYIHGHYPKLTQGVFTRVATKGDLTPAFGFSIHSSICLRSPIQSQSQFVSQEGGLTKISGQ